MKPMELKKRMRVFGTLRGFSECSRIITRVVQYTAPIVTLKLTLSQLQAELIEEGITKGVYSEAVVYRVIRGTLCKDKPQVKKILESTEAWW